MKGELRVIVTETLQRGWLAFQSATEKRRLAPIPQEWRSLSEAELVSLLERAESVGKPRRLIE